MLVADALPATRATASDLALDTLPVRATVLRRAGRPEQLLLRDGNCHVRLAIRSGTTASGPVRLRFALHGLRHLERQMLTLRQVAALTRAGRVSDSLTDRDRKAAHWITVLRVHDALAAGATQRDIAATLFGQDWVSSGWSGTSDFLRSRLRRLVAQRRRMVADGYRALLR